MTLRRIFLILAVVVCAAAAGGIYRASAQPAETADQIAQAEVPAGPLAAAPSGPEARPAPAAAEKNDNGMIRITPREAGVPAEALTEAGDDLISITLDDVPMEDVVRMFTRISGANIIASAGDLTGNVTVSLTDVQWKPALSSILDMHNLSLMEKEPGSGVYSVVPRPADAPKPMVTKSFQLNFATVSDVSPVVRTMLAEGATLSEFPSRNIIVVRSTPENLSDIAQIMTDVDQPTKQVCVETKFMELSDEASKQLGIRWDSLEEFAVRLDAGPFERTESLERAKSNGSTLSRWDKRQQQDDVVRMYDKDDVQYQVESTEIVELPDGSFLTTTKTDPSRQFTDSIDLGQEYALDISDSLIETISEAKAAILEVDNFELVLSALKKVDGVSVISNPKIIVANGATNAVFSVGTREPIIKTEVTRGTTESPGDKITAQLDTTINTEYIKEGYLETGIDLRVIPVVKTDDLIEAEIIPSLKRKTGTKTVGDNSWPIISIKVIKTKFTLRSGQTVAIGGLTDTSDESETSKIPLLGDIPLIGKYLFSHTKDVQKQTETIIFVTLSLAQPEELYKDIGIPEHAELVHKRIIQARTRRKKFEATLQKLESAGTSEKGEESDKAKSRLLRKRK